MKPLMRIHAAAERLGVSIGTLRRYEDRGIIPVAPRNPAGQRVYTPEDLERIRERVAVKRSE